MYQYQAIPDIFEVEHASQFSGSYTDAFLSGSIFDLDESVFVSYPAPTSTGKRRIAEFSKGSSFLTAVSSTIKAVEDAGFQWPAYYQIPQSIYYAHLKNRICGMGYRFMTLGCQSEIYHDSLIPDPIGTYKLNGGKLVFSNMEDFEFYDNYSPSGSGDDPGNDFFFNISSNSKLILAFGDTKVTASNNGSQISDNTWLMSYPNERRYKSVRRLTSPPYINELVTSDEYLAANVGGNLVEMRYHSAMTPLDTISNPAGSFLSLNYEVNIEFVVPSQSGDLITTTKMHKTAYEIVGLPIGPSLAFVTGSGYSLTKLGGTYADQIGNPFVKCFYGFGDGERNTPTFDTSATDHGGTSFYSRHTSPVIRGWKYGLYNGIPSTANIVFMRNKYGQIRHMLEQRKYTKFYDVFGLGNDGGVGGGKIGATTSPVGIKFVSGTLSYITSSIIYAATGTLERATDLNESGMFDFESKVGKPFYDQ